MAKRVLINLASENNLIDLAHLHYEALPGDFLPSLGVKYLERMYYPSALRSEHAKTFVISDKNKLMGFVTIAHNSARYTKEVLRDRWMSTVVYAAKIILRNPSFLLKCVEVIVTAAFSKPDMIESEIVYIAVSKEYRRKGTGTKLVVKAMEYLAEKGLSSCRTKTLAENTNVIRMYQNLGWYIQDQFRFIGKEYVTIAFVQGSE